jgi:hypothetical protein
MPTPGHGHQHDRDRADGDRAEDRVRHQEHADQREHDRRAREQHGAVGGGAGDGDGLADGQAGAALLAEARDDEQRVVDPDGEAHHHEHVHDDEVEDEHLADAGYDREGHDDARDRDADRHDRGRDAAEDDDQDEQREREPEQLAAHQVLLGGRAEVGVDRLLAHDQRAEAVVPVRGDDTLDDRLDVIAQLDEQQRAVLVVRHRAGADLARPGRAQRRGERAHAPLEARFAGSGARRRDDHRLVDVEGPVRADRRERALEDPLGPLGLRAAREVVLRGEGGAQQAADCRRRGEHGEEPGPDHEPLAPRTGSCQPLGEVPWAHLSLRSLGSHRTADTVPCGSPRHQPGSGTPGLPGGR